MTAKDTIKLLEAKHAKDIFVSECKTGPTWYGTPIRLDGLAMARSYAKPLVTGYEVKVSRGDFLRDDKWQNYLQYCNAFYFVCPSGLIDPAELPDQVGMLWVSKTGTRLFNKRKAHWRDVEIPADLYRYILFSRTRITKPNERPAESKVEFWTEWLKEKEVNRTLGHYASQSVAKAIDEKIDTVRKENAELKGKMINYDQIIELLVDLEIIKRDKHESNDIWALKRRANEVRKAVPSGLPDRITTMIQSLENFQANLEKITQRKD